MIMYGRFNAMTKAQNIGQDARTDQTHLKVCVLSVRSGMSRGQTGRVRQLSELSAGTGSQTFKIEGCDLCDRALMGAACVYRHATNHECGKTEHPYTYLIEAMVKAMCHALTLRLGITAAFGGVC